ncbi:MAG: DUF192 domain-containing protein [Woeseiaceae bacterium]|nr:DUF192 domain-containing protein [Woeseiaceae bacterium]
MTALRSLLLGICVVPLLAIADEELDAAFDKDVLVIVAREHVCFRFEIHLAIDNEQHKRGLMFVRELPPMSGMLFVYPDEAYRSMWMKNTYIPLDILFARRDGKVSNIVPNTVPLSLESISSTEPVTFVLELNAGTTKRLSIDAGSRLIWETD